VRGENEEEGELSSDSEKEEEDAEELVLESVNELDLGRVEEAKAGWKEGLSESTVGAPTFAKHEPSRWPNMA
jgi:hypothetical protein